MIALAEQCVIVGRLKWQPLPKQLPMYLVEKALASHKSWCGAIHKAVSIYCEMFELAHPLSIICINFQLLCAYDFSRPLPDIHVFFVWEFYQHCLLGRRRESERNVGDIDLMYRYNFPVRMDSATFECAASSRHQTGMVCKEAVLAKDWLARNDSIGSRDGYVHRVVPTQRS